jgi:segregation and condensation protein B
MGEVARLFDVKVDPPAEIEPEALRIAEALVFAAAEPIDEADIAPRLPEGSDVRKVMAELQRVYAGRGVNLVRVQRKWAFRTAVDLAWLMSREDKEQKKLSRAAIETLAIIAYHQPVTRADVEEIRGVAVSKGALDVLMETGWIRMRGRRKAPGRPITYGTTTDFLVHFGLESIGDLPGLDELKGAGLFEGKLPPGFGVPAPNDDEALATDEDPLEETAAIVEAYGPQAIEEEAPEADREDEINEEERETSDREERDKNKPET